MVRCYLLFSFFVVFVLSSSGQYISFQSFEEAGGSVTTGEAGAISTLSNGDVIIANERYTNFSKKGIQVMRLDKESLLPTINRAYFNDFTIQNIFLQVRDDSVYMVAQHNNGGVYKLLFMVFDANLNLIRSSLSNCPKGLIFYGFWADTDGSFRIHGGELGGSTLSHYVLSINRSGAINWSKSIGPDIYTFGGSALLSNGQLVFGSGGNNSGYISAIDRSGNLVWSKDIGSDWAYTINGASIGNEAYITRYSYDSSLIYALRMDENGTRKGQTAGAYMNSPLFTEVLPNGTTLIAASSFEDFKVTLKIAEFNKLGQYVKNHHIDNVFGPAPTGATRDACRYDSHVDAQGNFYVLGVANRQGFFVLRLEQDLAFDCSYYSSASDPGPIPEGSTHSYTLSPLPFAWDAYPFIEETASQYKVFCSSCGSKFIKTLDDTALCLWTATYTLDAKNAGAKYLWSDGSTQRTLDIQESGIYWVRLVNACDTVYDSVEVVLSVRPKINISYSPQDPLPGETILFVGIPDTFSVMNWYLNDTLFTQGASFAWTSDRNGIYHFVWEVYDDPSCSARDSLSIKISLVDYYIPTAFSPNANGLNDTWGPVGSGIESYTARIFNRWGQIVYEGNNRNWDGTFKGRGLMTGLYSYIVELIDSDGIRHEHRGTITLIH